MNREQKVSPRQFGILAVLYSIGTTILISPAVLTAEAKQDAWLAATLGVGFGLLLVLLYNKVGSLYTAKNLVELMETLLGKWLGKAIAVTFVFFAFVTSAELLYLFGNFITTQIMPETPIQAVNILFASIIVIGSRLGIEVLARFAELLFPVFIGLFLVLVVFVSPKIHTDNLLPMMESSVGTIVGTAIYFTSIFSLSIVVMLMIFPESISRPGAARKAFFRGTLIGGIILLVVILLSLLVLGVDATARQIYPSYSLAKKINVGNFLQRIEIIMAMMWFISIYFRLSCYFHAAVKGLAQVLNVKDYRFLVVPMGITMITLSLIVHPNILHSAMYNRETWLVYASTYGLLLPLLLLAVHAVRQKFGKGGSGGAGSGPQQQLEQGDAASGGNEQ
ncbi:endospore germination permease [Paenibacillus sp. J5C_2022]|uniref:GerAB/ArcD/ProY family transporter n=1 Tax=Paenibacillus sp. J5C2022 TaxID=2977129 RepID=UPI0021D20DFA|nr:endospore germination permease [Paenibacillus sp. J5C2022]MCU6710769.1 endospore germination permease [Paenibacillus sp. J5C2022]